MPAVIFGNRFRGRGEPAWHGIGETFSDDPSAIEAYDLADLLYEVYRKPVAVEIDGQYIEIADKFAIVRDAIGAEEPQILSIVGNEFRPVQNRTIAEALDASGLLDSYQIETVGALGTGETVFTALSERDGEFEIAGSPVKSYWTLYDGKDGNKALGFMWTPVKVVCSNTLVMGLKAASVNVKIQHTERAEVDLKFWLEIAPKLKAAQDESKSIMQSLAKFEVDEDGAMAILSAAYPVGKQNGKVSLRNMPTLNLSAEQAIEVDRAVNNFDRAALRQWEKLTLAKDVFEDYVNQPEEKGQAGTAWGVYEAVCDVEDHREESRTTENVFESALVGARSRSKRDAFAAAMSVAGIAK